MSIPNICLTERYIINLLTKFGGFSEIIIVMLNTSLLYFEIKEDVKLVCLRQQPVPKLHKLIFEK